MITVTFSTGIAKSCGTVPLSHGMIPAAWDGWKEFLLFTTINFDLAAFKGVDQ
jgi:hypothetical protein